MRLHHGLALNLIGRLYTLMPIPSYLNAHCTARPDCGHRASHRLFSRAAARVTLLCDEHTLEFARAEGVNGVGR